MPELISIVLILITEISKYYDVLDITYFDGWLMGDGFIFTSLQALTFLGDVSVCVCGGKWSCDTTLQRK